MKADMISHFEELKDPRVDRTKRYPLKEIILRGTVANTAYLAYTFFVSKFSWEGCHDNR